MSNVNSTAQGPMSGAPQSAGAPQLQMNGTSASAIHALPASLPGQSASALTQKLAATQDSDVRRTMLGESALYPLSCAPQGFYLSTALLPDCIERPSAPGEDVPFFSIFVCLQHAAHERLPVILPSDADAIVPCEMCRRRAVPPCVEHGA